MTGIRGTDGVGKEAENCCPVEGVSVKNCRPLRQSTKTTAPRILRWDAGNPGRAWRDVFSIPIARSSIIQLFQWIRQIR